VVLKKIYSHALRLLTGRDYFSGELAGALAKKFPDEKETISEVLAIIVKDGYLNDERALKNYVGYKVRQGYGPYYIREKLSLKGIPVQIHEIEAAIEEGEIDINAVIRKAAEKYRQSRRKSGRAFVESCVRYLSGRGFALGESIKICKEVANDESDFS
jgi:regulatory protein